MKKIVLLFCVSAALIKVNKLEAQVLINEYCAANVAVNADNFGENSDWIELYNAGASAVNLNGYWLSDKVADIQKWQMPAINLNPGGRVLIWCSGRDITTGPYHTNFGLTQSEGNDHVILADPAGTILDSTNVRRCFRNQSRGRSGDGGASWGVFTTPTPNAANGTTVSYAERPNMSLSGGIYAGPINVTLSTTDPSLTIRYTTNGSTPTATSTLYSGPIAINNTTVLRARAFSTNSGVLAGFTETHTYFIGVNHVIPIVSLWGDQPLNQLFNGTENTPDCGMEYFSNTGTLLEKTYGDANKHGNDSWAYPQRGIDYIVRDKFGYSEEIDYQIFPVKNRDKFDRIILKPAANDNYPFEDGAYVRDAYVHTLSILGNLELDERTSESVVLYKNGQYWGIYEIREKADDKDYIEHYYGIEESNIQFLKTWGGTWADYGGGQAQADWDALRQFIQNNNMGNPANFAQVDAQYNWRSLIDYFCINSYTVCTDWLNWNTAWWRGINTPATNPRSKWTYALWDMDATFGHYLNYTGVPNTSPTADPCNAETLPNPGGQGHTQILTKLIEENPMVYQYYVSRYIDLGNTTFSCPFMIAALDSMLAVFGPEMPGQIARWGGNINTYNGHVQQLKNFILQRCVEIQDGMVDCYDVEGPYPTVFTVDPIGAGTLQVNSLLPATYPYTGTYYGNIDIITNAFANAGWVFDYWESANGTSVINPDILNPNALTRITGPDTIIAHFVQEAPPEFDLTVTVNPPLSGNVNVAGFTPPAYPWTGTYFENTNLNLIATPVAGYEFDYWELNNHLILPNDTTTPGSFVITETDTLIAHFKLIPVIEPPAPSEFPLVVKVVPAGGGKVNLNNFLINVYPYSAVLDSNTTVTADAVASNGYQFSNWTIQHHNLTPSNTSASVSFKINQADTLTAYFEEMPAEIRPNPMVFVPNSFSPNNDPLNGIFRVIYNSDVVSGELNIFDRWGQLVFTSRDLDFGWDGTMNGTAVPSGAYSYTLKYTYLPAKTAYLTGSVLLIR
jgi:gliding motility-associated-like protein